MEITKELNILLDTGIHVRPVVADIFYRADNVPKPVVIFAHGFKGFKDWGCWNMVAERFAREGFVFVKLNFSHNGTTPGSLTEFTDLEAFGNNNFSKELHDLGVVIDWVENHAGIKGNIDPGKISLIGHSRGGGIGIIKAKEDARVKKLVTWASVSSFEGFFPADPKAWEEQGVIYTANARTGQQMPLYYQLFEDYHSHKNRFDVLDACAHLRIPLLIIHGTNDEAVNYRSAQLLERYSGKARLLLIEGAGHTFGAKHPFEGDELPKHMETVVKETIDFLR